MEKFNILFVDDEPDILLNLKQTFNFDDNLNLYFANSAKEGLEIIDKNMIDIILSDQKMPQMTGIDFFKITKTKYPDTLRILITSYTDIKDTIKAVNEGEIYRYINKPWDILELRGLIFAALDYIKLKKENIKMVERIKRNNIELEIKVTQRTKEIKKVQNISIFSLARLAESRDPETGDHLMRIREYCKVISVKLAENGLYPNIINKKYIDNIYHSSPLHDIGKVGIPDHILLKPGKLTPGEFDIMKTHSTIGGKTLEDAEKQLKNALEKESFLTMGKEIAYYHHEKWNGSGYPAGLLEKKIPLCARIIALADVYDALRVKRPYKEAIPHEKAREIIIQEKGHHFDPDIVDIFLNNETQFLEISKKI